MVTLLVMLFVIVALFALFPLSSERLNKALFWIFGFFLFLLAAFRSESQSPDYSAYLLMYQDYDTLIVEPSFTAISWLVKTVFDNSLFLFIIYAFLAVFIKLKAIQQYSPLLLLGLLTYISLTYIIQEHAQIRAGVATAFFLLAIKPLCERNLKLFLFLILCSILFHFSAIIALPLWFVAGHNPKKWLLWGLIPLGYLIYFSGINLISTALPFDYIQSKLELYQAMQEAGVSDFDNINVFGFGVLLKILFFYLLLAFRKLIQNHNIYIDSILMIYAVGIFFIPAFATMPVVSYRLSAILVSVEVLLFPMFYYIFVPKFIGRLAVVLVAAVNLYLSLNIIS